MSATDSNADQFDTITDFRSGSDRIDLTALGAFALLALTSISTSVPAHTIAWFYDSASNETIVYVNPTDTSLSIGDSGLVEIHLQGIATIQASDFVPEPSAAPVVLAAELIDPELAATTGTDEAVVTTVTADASFGWTGSDGAYLADADGNATLPTAWKGDSFDFSRSDEVQTQPTERNNDDEAVILTSGPSIELHRVHVAAPTESGPAWNQTSALDAAVHDTCLTVLNDDRDAPQRVEHDRTPDGAGNADDAHGHASHASSNIGPNFEALEVREHGGDDHHSISGELNKHDTASKHGGPDFEPSTAHVASGSAADHPHGLGDSFHFKDKISAPDVSDVGEVDHAPASIVHRGSTASTSEPLAISEIAQTIETASPEHHASDDSKHHWSDNVSNGPDHAWSGASTHAAHDLMV